MSPPPSPAPESLVQHASFVRGVARAVLRGDDRVEDVIQDTWVAALEQAESRRGPLRPWLAGIARHKALRVLRGDRRRGRAEAALEPPTGAPSAAALAARAETGRRVAAAVLQLAEPYRETVLLRYHEGLRPREIAARQGLSVETVKTRLRRGLRQLREALAEDDDARRRLALLVLGGGVAMKKSVAFLVLAFLLLFGGGMALAPWLLREEPPSVEETVSARPGSEDPRLAGRGAARVRDPSSPDRSGMDLEDADRDHDLFGVVVDPAGRPFAGAELQAMRYPWTERSLLVYDEHADEADEIARTRSGEDGTFRMRLGRGRQVGLRVRAEGFASLELRRLQAGERAEIVLRPAATLRLRVHDAQGRPVEGAWCRVRHAMDERRLFLATGTSDSEGEFVATDLPGGARCMAWALGPPVVPGQGSLRSVTLSDAGETVRDVLLTPTAALRGRVVDGETNAPIAGARVSTSWAMIPAARTDKDGGFELTAMAPTREPVLYVEADGYARDRFPADAAGGTVVRLVRGWAVTGRVVDPEGRGIGPVLLRAVGTVPRDATRNHSFALGRAEPDGRFWLAGLRPGVSHTLVLMAEGRGTVMLDLDTPEASPLALGDVVLPEGCAVEGVIRDPEGTPLGGVNVTLGGSPDGRDRVRTATGYVGWMFSGAAERRTDDLGRFRFPDLAPGTYHLRAANGAGGSVEAEVRLDEKDVVRALVLAGTRTVRVSFAGPDGPLLEGWSVRPEIAGMPRTWRPADPSGRVVFEAPRAEIVLFTWLGADQPFHAPARTIRVPPDRDEVVVRLRPASLVRGRLVDADDAPLPLAQVQARWSKAGRSSAITDAKGAFVLRVDPGVLVDVVWDGTVTSRGTMGGQERRLMTAEQTTVKADAGAIELRARAVERGRALTVRILDPDGRPVPGAAVTLLRVPGVEKGTATAGDGRARFEDLPAIPIQARWAFPGSPERPWFLRTADPVVPAGQEILIRARRAVTIDGHVLHHDGTPAGDAYVYSHGPSRSRGYAKTDATGRFVLYLDPEDTESHVLETSVLDAKRRRLATKSPPIEPGARAVTLRLPRPAGDG